MPVRYWLPAAVASLRRGCIVRYRLWRLQARQKRRGRWRDGEDSPSSHEQSAIRPPPFPWWQG